MNLFDKHQPLYAPEGVDGGAADVDTGGDTGGAPPPALPRQNETPVDGPGSGRSKLRGQLEKATEDTRRADDKGGKYKSRARQEQEGQGEGQEAEGDQEAAKALEGQDQAQQGTQQAQQGAAPEGWSKEAKAEWAKTPANVQAAVLKREQDVAAGVASLRQNYADIDKALTAPRVQAIRTAGHTPGAAINQLFGWMEALTVDANLIKTGKTNNAFTKLAESFGIDPAGLVQHIQAVRQKGGQQQQAQKGGQPNLEGASPQVIEYVQRLEAKLGEKVGALEQQFGNVTTSMQQQADAKTAEILDMFSKDKPFYNEPGVRPLMAQLMSPGPNGAPPVIAPLPNGNADLNAAYDYAINALPAVRAKMSVAAQQEAERVKQEAAAAEKKANKDAVDRARKAQGGSLVLGPPGTPASAQKQPVKKGKSVRESLNEAITQVAGRDA